MPNPPAFFDRQTPEIIALTRELVAMHTVSEATEHLKSIGVDGVTQSLVERFKRKHGLSNGYRAYTEPAPTLDERILQYITAIKLHDGNEFTSKYLGLPGHIWTPCALRLCKANLIERMDNRQPAHYTQICSDEEIDNWYSEMIKA